MLDVIAHSCDHLTPAAIYERVCQGYLGIGRVTVYRTLDMLVELGLVCKVHTEGDYRSYLMRRHSEHHHHLVCSECGMAVNFTACNLGEVERRLSRETKFNIKGHLLEFIGCCPACQKVAST